MLHQIDRPLAWGLVGVLLLSSSALGQFVGNAFFSTAPTSDLGAVTNNLVITNTANGFTVTGDATIAVTGPATGFLVEWVIDRPLAPSFVFSNWTTTTALSGFSLPPPGVVQSTNGQVSTEFTEPGMQSGSQSSIFISLTNGAAVWPPPGPDTSSTFSGATPAAPTYFLRQHFWIDGVYQSGPGGNWVVDVPVDSTITQVPEPTTLGILSTVGLVLLMRRTRAA